MYITVHVNEGIMCVHVHTHTLKPSSQTHQWQLSPVEAGSLAMRAVLHTSTQEIGGDPSHHHKPRRHKATLELFGQGLHGEIQVHDV